MKTLARVLVLNAVSLYALQFILPAIQFSGGWKTYVEASVTLAVLNWIVRPLLELVLLPINLLTLGMFRWVSMTAVFWLMTKFVHGLTISIYHFPGYAYGGIIVPPTMLTIFWTMVVATFLLTSIMAVVEWVMNR